MGVKVLPVEAKDVIPLVEKCEVPAMRENPLSLLMFPNKGYGSVEHVEWIVGGLKQSLLPSATCIRKACEDNGQLVGFAEWTLDFATPDALATLNNAFDNASGTGNQHQNKSNWLPDGLDARAWLAASKLLRLERERVLQHCSNVWRK